MLICKLFACLFSKHQPKKICRKTDIFLCLFPTYYFTSQKCLSRRRLNALERHLKPVRGIFFAKLESCTQAHEAVEVNVVVTHVFIVEVSVPRARIIVLRRRPIIVAESERLVV